MNISVSMRTFLTKSSISFERAVYRVGGVWSSASTKESGAQGGLKGGTEGEATWSWGKLMTSRVRERESRVTGEFSVPYSEWCLFNLSSGKWIASRFMLLGVIFPIQLVSLLPSREGQHSKASDPFGHMHLTVFVNISIYKVENEPRSRSHCDTTLARMWGSHQHRMGRQTGMVYTKARFREHRSQPGSANFSKQPDCLLNRTQRLKIPKMSMT